jgi:hypothetical protein
VARKREFESHQVHLDISKTYTSCCGGRRVEANVDVTGRHRFARSLLLAFTRRMAPLVTENVTEATHAQLDATHAQVSAWLRDFSPREWS